MNRILPAMWPRLLMLLWMFTVEWRDASSFQIAHRQYTSRHDRPPSNPFYGQVSRRVHSETSIRRAVSSSKGSEEDDKQTMLDDVPSSAYPQQTPHSGRHFLPSHPAYRRKSLLSRLVPSKFRRAARKMKRKRFMEGWYYRITLPEDNVSFAFIASIEDPFGPDGPQSDVRLAAMQIMGPDDEYLVQSTKDDAALWAWEHRQGLGCTFEYKDGVDAETLRQRTALDPDGEWDDAVSSGFQVLPDRFKGKIAGHDGSKGGVHKGQGIPGRCDFDFTVRPVAGWGDCSVSSDPSGNDGVVSSGQQKSTAGWLASFAVFEPHWQVTLADGRATGVVTWKNRTFEFEDAPFYAEKNWGGAFPERWYWCQCNSFDGYSALSVTAGGGTRQIPLGQKESLGMVCVHHDGTFYEAVPWTGSMEWEVDPWGRWVMKGRCTSGERLFESEITAFCDVDGVVLRAPTKVDGMEYFCRDSFYADTTLSLWELTWDENKKEHVRGRIIIDSARSKQGAVEVGGGPWWYTWKGTSLMKQPMRCLVRFPYLLRGWKRTNKEGKK